MKNLLALPRTLLLCLPSLIKAQQACPMQQPLTYRMVHEQVISINTDVLYNTTFNPIRDVTVTVDNAPTSMNGLTTFWWTESKTYMESHSLSRTTSAMHTTATPADSSFVILVMGEQHNHKRQSGSWYVSVNGTITNDCTTSPIYTISNGQLTATVNQVVYTYSTSTEVPYALFMPSTIPGTITQSFSLSGSKTLTWTNSAFFNGQASFCALANGTVFAVFQQNAQPDGCLYIQLSLFSISSCQGISFATITGPPGRHMEDDLLY